MQPIIHFLLSIVAGVGVGIHMESKTKKALLILLLAIAATCIDLDHLLPMYHESGVKLFHNIFVFVLFPVALLLTFFIYERKKNSTIKQRSCLLLCVMFVGHMFLDGISGSGVPLFYPFNSERYTVGNLGITIDSTLFSLSSAQVIMIVWGGIICWANLIETITYNEVECKKPFRFMSWRDKKLREGKKNLATAFMGGISIRRRQKPHPVQTCDIGHQDKEETIPNDDLSDYLIDLINNMPD